MNQPLHTIRLRGAWSVTTDGTHTRPFGWPTALDPGERVWLVCSGWRGPASVAVNDTSVGELPTGVGHLAADITALLRPRNQLAITRDASAPTGEVVLEVRRADSAPG